MTLSVSGDSITFPDLSTLQTAPSGFGFKNRIINGDMRIDQRNAGASVTISGASIFGVDRFQTRVVGGGAIAMQRSAVAPAGFVNSELLTVTTADTSIATTDECKLTHVVEGFNIADLGWGTANGQAITLSFWVRSSITGTYTVAMQNSAENRSYPATYTINTANTWEQKVIAVPGDTSGTWLVDNSIGMRVSWSLGSGATYNGTANSWNASDARATSGQTQWIGTTGATFYITGVQLEKGSTATAFDYRDYGRELIMCQRYYFKQGNSNAQYLQIGIFVWDGTANCSFNYQLPVTMRAIPTFSKSGAFHSSFGAPNINGMITDFSASTTKVVGLQSAGGSGGTTGYSSYIRAQNDFTAYFDFSAEL